VCDGTIAMAPTFQSNKILKMNNNNNNNNNTSIGENAQRQNKLEYKMPT
jgi:hypothetical protein